MKVEISKSDLESVQSLLSEIKNGAPRAISGALNQALTTTKTQAVKSIGADITLKAARIKKDFTVKKSSWKDLQGSVSASGEPVGLAQFQARQTAKGVTVKVKRSGERALLKHAFMSSTKSGTHVWWRGGRSTMPAAKKFPVGKKSTAAWPKMPNQFRFPAGPKGDSGILRLTGPRIEDIFASEQRYKQLLADGGTAFASYLDKKVVEVLRRFG